MLQVLVVDDSDIDRIMIETLLKSQGITCIAADNGHRALEKLKEWNVDLILTDLDMPHMDGLSLVRALVRDSIKIPVILTTGVGNEHTASDALLAGAASYIPKNRLKEMLIPSVQRVLEISLDNRQLHDFSDALRTAHYEFEFGNEPEKLFSLVQFISRTMHSILPIERNEQVRLAMALDQALNNALYRGNLEISSSYKIGFNETVKDQVLGELLNERMTTKPYCDRKIQVVIDIKPTRFAMRVRDGGVGFDHHSYGSWEHPEARGIVLMKAFMDRIEFAGKGNDVQLYKFFDGDVQHADSQKQAVGGGVNAPHHLGRHLLVALKSGEELPLQSNKLVFGSRSECHVRMTGKSIAPLHCMMLPEMGSWVLVQISPDYRTYVNMKPVDTRTRLAHGDIIQVGNFEFEYRIASAGKAKAMAV